MLRAKKKRRALTAHLGSEAGAHNVTDALGRQNVGLVRRQTTQALLLLLSCGPA